MKVIKFRTRGGGVVALGPTDVVDDVVEGTAACSGCGWRWAASGYYWADVTRELTPHAKRHAKECDALG